MHCYYEAVWYVYIRLLSTPVSHFEKPTEKIVESSAAPPGIVWRIVLKFGMDIHGGCGWADVLWASERLVRRRAASSCNASHLPPFSSLRCGLSVEMDVEVILCLQACEKTCYQRNVIEQCQCSDAHFPPSNASAFNYVDVLVCSTNNLTQGTQIAAAHVPSRYSILLRIAMHKH